MRALAGVVLGLVAACAAEPAVPAWEWALPAGFQAPRVPDDNPMSAEKVELGRHLFFDTRLSGNGTQACASCHDPARAFTDGRAVPVGSTGELGRRNAMSLGNVAYASTQTWAGLARELEEQALVPMFGEAPVELGLAGREAELVARLAAEPRYEALFAAAFPDDVEPITIANLARALASFERTLITGGSRFDRFLAGDASALDDAERRGLALFESDALGCRHCHDGFNLTSSVEHAGMRPGGDAVFFNTGLYDVDGAGGYPASDRGLVEVTNAPGDVGRFKPPTLRNIARTAPYMHDGSVATLGEVIDIYARGGRLVPDGPHAGDGAASPRKSLLVTGFSLAPDERADLLAFLAALTDDGFVTDPRFTSPW